MSDATPSTPAPRPRPVYRKAVGPKLRYLLIVVFVLAAVLAANSVYLAAITFLEWFNGETYQDYVYLQMFLAHLVLGAVFVVPLILFGLLHMRNTFRRKNRRAVRVGYALFFASIVLLVTGLLLVRISGVIELKNPSTRAVVYWLHVACPLVCVWLYWLHRLAGPPIKWAIARRYAAVVGVAIACMVGLRLQDPREWNQVGPASGEKYFFPSLARTSTGNFIQARSLMNDQYCLKCHADVHAGWKDSVHHISSFNNPAYLASIRDTRKVLLDRDDRDRKAGHELEVSHLQASRWCAGCHDPVPFFSGAFDDPKFDDVNHPTAHAGITCTVCHAITRVNSNRGNADYTIDEPMHYPFAYSENETLQWVNNQLVKAKPSFHKKTFLKPLHKSAEFCSTCHKVHLPHELTEYKEFLRGQNHYDSYLTSGVSGHGARSFYYPPTAQTNCNGCHMPLKPSDDFGAKLFGSDELSVHDHLFPSANTAIAWWRNRPDVIQAHQDFLKGVMRVDLFGIREQGTISGAQHAPLRPQRPALVPGNTYLVETVIRTMKMGHLFTQGTADSNEVWLDVTVKDGDQIIGRSGGLDAERAVDRWAHFVNAFVIDKHGDRIAFRNAQDIYTVLYNNQIPPGAGQTVLYRLTIPPDAVGPITIDARLQYRKFDAEYVAYIAEQRRPEDGPLRGQVWGQPYRNPLPITTLAADHIVLPLESQPTPESTALEVPEWIRWNDYGIGMLRKAASSPGALSQAAAAFERVEQLGRYDGALNLARVHFREGAVDKATRALQRAAEFDDPPAPRWTLAWLNGEINRQQGRFPEAVANFKAVVDPENRTQEMINRNFDFSLDYVVLNQLGQTLFDQSKNPYYDDYPDEREELMREAIEVFQRTLAIDSENVDAHYNLGRLYALTGDAQRAAEHQRLHSRFKPDDNARDIAVPPAREKYPAANAAAEGVVIYKLQRPGAPELPPLELSDSSTNPSSSQAGTSIRPAKEVN